jgi:hypothetical protein
MSKLLLGIGYGIIAQILTFIQLQGNIKYDWYKKYPIPLLLAAVPISWLFIKSVENLVLAYNGEIWASRFWGFSIGILTFTIMSKLLFNEPFTTKTFICVLLSFTIIFIQLFWK